MFNLIIIFLASIIVGFAFNMFLLPHEILTGGITGVAMIVGLLSKLNTGVVIFILNIPILIAGYLKLGKKFIFYSLLSVGITSASMQVIPKEAISTDPLLSSLFGGAVVGIGVGLIIRSGGSTGGFDVVGLILTKKRDLPLGSLIFIMNSIVVFISGFLFNWDAALYTMASIFVTGKVVDAIHTRHIKLTVSIITSQGSKVKDELLKQVYRGITVFDGQGAFSKENRVILYTVVTRYELTNLKEIVKRTDPHAFVNINETIEVIGSFRRSE